MSPHSLAPHPPVETFISTILSPVHPSWHATVKRALQTMDSDYLVALSQQQAWLPGAQNLLNAFRIPQANVQHILLGESPYPREQSANGYAFWDGAVHEIWSPTGLSKPVNRATSLRHFIKMLLVAGGALQQDTSQPSIASLAKSNYVQTLDDLFNNMLNKGFLLLNASLVLSNASVRHDARAWQPFIHSLLTQLAVVLPNTHLILFGKIAQMVKKISNLSFPTLEAEHPYNISFVQNPEVIAYFKPLALLRAL